jgi:hypothetical protein
MAQSAVIGVQIPANQALSGMIDLGTHKLVAIEMPEAWAGGAVITFQAKAKVATDDTLVAGDANPEDWDDVYDDAGTEVSVTVAANRVVVIGTVTKAAIGALRYIRIRSGTSASPVNQNPARDLRLIVKGD